MSKAQLKEILREYGIPMYPYDMEQLLERLVKFLKMVEWVEKEEMLLQSVWSQQLVFVTFFWRESISDNVKEEWSGLLSVYKYGWGVFYKW